jgi:hypothetical protein
MVLSLPTVAGTSVPPGNRHRSCPFEGCWAVQHMMLVLLEQFMLRNAVMHQCCVDPQYDAI